MKTNMNNGQNDKMNRSMDKIQILEFKNGFTASSACEIIPILP